MSEERFIITNSGLFSPVFCGNDRQEDSCGELAHSSELSDLHKQLPRKSSSLMDSPHVSRSCTRSRKTRVANGDTIGTEVQRSLWSRQGAPRPTGFAEAGEEAA